MARRRRRTDPDGQLTELMLQVLLVLAEEPRHGYSMLQRIEERSDAPFTIGPATLYRTLQRLLDAGLIEETATDGSHSQRRAYRITDLGRERAARDAARLERLVAWARSTAVLRPGRG